MGWGCDRDHYTLYTGTAGGVGRSRLVVATCQNTYGACYDLIEHLNHLAHVSYDDDHASSSVPPLCLPFFPCGIGYILIKSRIN
jgi:hypothetical protein